MLIASESETGPIGTVDLFIGAVGYESRSSWLLETATFQANKYIGLRFGYGEELNYVESLNSYKRRSSQIVVLPRSGKVSFFTKAILGALADSDISCRIVIDISSMSRTMIAVTLLAITDGLAFESRFASVEIFIHYVPAKYVAPADAMPLRYSAPVIPEMAGWSTHPNKPLGLIAGLGYEPGLALGACQYLEPTKIWAFTPVGSDERFGSNVNDANRHLDDIFDVTRISYNLRNPVQTRILLYRLIQDVLIDYRIVFMPFGPKLFAWQAMITAIEEGLHETSVWRFSADSSSVPVERIADGPSIWHQMMMK